MAECLECQDGMSIEDILRKVTTCDAEGNVSWNLYEVEDSADCFSCDGGYDSLEDILRKSLYCEGGVWYLRVKIA